MWSPVWSITTQGEKLKKDWAGKEKGGWGKGGYSIGGKNHMYSKWKDNKMIHKKKASLRINCPPKIHSAEGKGGPKFVLG